RRFEARRPDAFVGVVSPEQDRRARRKVPSQWAAGGLYMAAVVNRMIVVDDRDPAGKKPASCRRESEARTLTSDFPGARYFADELNCSSAGRSPENRNRAIGEAWVPQSITAGARASSANRALQIADDWQPLAGQPSGGDDDQRPQRRAHHRDEQDGIGHGPTVVAVLVGWQPGRRDQLAFVNHGTLAGETPARVAEKG